MPNNNRPLNNRRPSSPRSIIDFDRYNRPSSPTSVMDYNDNYQNNFLRSILQNSENNNIAWQERIVVSPEREI